MGHKRKHSETKPYFVGGTTNAICDASGFKCKRSELVKRWDGYWVLPEFNHPRQPQDFAPKIIPQVVLTGTRPPTITEEDAPPITPI